MLEQTYQALEFLIENEVAELWATEMLIEVTKSKKVRLASSFKIWHQSIRSRVLEAMKMKKAWITQADLTECEWVNDL